ncbi:hypothetical protein SNE40_002250 [Patella caerulea]|uniref:Uncharacterized protein n=1 Tax=Patella caerulea TaxID=87958 RepID=A0AAN8K2X2_PATCE
MIKKEDLCRVFLVYVCLFHVVPAHPCGENPLRGFISLSRVTGRDVNRLLGILENANFDLFKRIEGEWNSYANCVGMVDTGYFKRSSGYQREATQDSNSPQVHRLTNSSALLKKIYNQISHETKRNSQNDSAYDSDLVAKWLIKSWNPLFGDYVPLTHSRLISDTKYSRG